MNKQTQVIFRWIAILPIAALLIFLSLTLFDIIGKVTSPPEVRFSFYNSKPYLYFWSPLSTIFCSFIVITISKYIAPSSKKDIVLVCTFFFVITGLGMGYTTYKNSIDGNTLDRLYGDIGFIIGSIIALYKFQVLIFQKKLL